MNISTNLYIHQCQYCNKIFMTGYRKTYHENHSCKLNNNIILLKHKPRRNYPKTICKYCNKQISNNAYKAHIKSHENGNYDKINNGYHLDHDDLFCKFCHKELKNKNALRQHECRCKLNPNKYQIYYKNRANHQGPNNPMYGKTAWNKGLTKQSDSRIQQISNTLINTINKKRLLGQKYGGISLNSQIELKRKLKISNTMKDKNLVKNFKHHRKICYYNGYSFDSSYEVLVAQSLDYNKIKWQKPKRFKYYEDNDINKSYHYYTPDFYLPDYDVYLDPKNDFLINNINPNLGFKDINKIKWVELFNNIRVIILTKNELNWDIIKTKL